MNINYETDLNWDGAIVTPLGRFYNALLQMGIGQDKVFEIIHALTESGAYQESLGKLPEQISA